MNLDQDPAMMSSQQKAPKLQPAQYSIVPSSWKSSLPSQPKNISSRLSLKKISSKSRNRPTTGRNDYQVRENITEEEEKRLLDDKSKDLSRQAQNVPSPTNLPNLPADKININEPHPERNTLILRPKLQHTEMPKHKKKKNEAIDMRAATLVGKPPTKENKWLKPFHPENNFRLLWELIVLLTMMIDLIILPLDIAFGIFARTRPFGYVSSGILALDVLVNFHTSFYRHGTLVTSHRKIARHYLRTWFIPDIIAAFPFWTISLFFNEEEYSPDQPYLAIQLVRLIKLFKLTKVLRDFKFSIFLKRYRITSIKVYYIDTFIVLWNLAFLLLLLSHWGACIWAYIGALELAAGDEVNWLNNEGIADDSVMVRYAYSFYWAMATVLTVGYGDVTAVTIAEMWFANFCMLFGRGLYAYVITAMAMLVFDLRRREAEISDRIYEVNGFLGENSLSRETKSRVNNYMRFMFEEDYMKKTEQQRILSDVPKKLRNQISIELNSNILLANIVFAANFGKDFLVDLSFKIRENIVCPGDIVDKGKIKKNNETKFYIIARGCIQLTFRSAKKPLKTLKVGKYFGEVTFFSDKETRLEAKSLTFSRLYSISKREFLEVLDNHPDAREAYCLIHDKINLYRDYSDLRSKCAICRSEEHNTIECCFFNLTLTSEAIIGISKARDLDFRRRFIRKGKRHHFKVVEPKSLAYKLFQDKHFECSSNKKTRRNSLDYIPNLEKLRGIDDECMVEPREVRCNRVQKPKWGSKSFTSIPDQVLKKRECLCQNCVNRRNCTQNMDIGLCDLNNHYGYKFKDDDIQPKEEIIFDQVKIFEKYFPHNNVDNVLHYLNSANEEKRGVLANSQVLNGIIYNSMERSTYNSGLIIKNGKAQLYKLSEGHK